MRSRLVLGLLTAVSAAAFAADPIRSVDFKNFAYPWDEPLDGIEHPMEWLAEVPRKMVRLKKGLHTYPEPGVTETRWPHLEFRKIVHGDLDGDGREEAAVDLLYSTGGTANWHYLYVNRLEKDQPKLLGALTSGSRAYGGLTGMNFRKGLLVLEFADGNRSIADCCSEGYVRMSDKLVRRRFLETGPREFGDYPKNTN